MKKVFLIAIGIVSMILSLYIWLGVAALLVTGEHQSVPATFGMLILMALAFTVVTAIIYKAYKRAKSK